MRQRGAARVWQVSGASIAGVVGLWLGPTTGDLARAETADVSRSGATGLGNRGWSAPEVKGAAPTSEPENKLEVSARAGFASDYIYRGTTLNNREPAAGAAFEARFSSVYAGATMATVKLPTQP